MRWKVLAAAAALCSVLLVPLCCFTVDRAEFVYLTQFGRRVAVFDGGDDTQAGLHFKWPWPIQSVQRIDRRLQTFDIPGAELLTWDSQGNAVDKPLTLDAYVCWRVPDADSADQFVRSVGTVERAKQVLAQRIASDLGSFIAKKEQADLFSTDPDRVDSQREALRQDLLSGGKVPLREAALRDYGIEIVDVRLRRINHPASVKEEIYARIRSKRGERVAQYKSEGESEADQVRTRTDREVEKMKEDARKRADLLRAAAVAEADDVRARAQAADAELFDLLQAFESYQAFLGDGKSTILISTHRPLFERLFGPAKGKAMKKGE
jgi:membrane protease subunit HflC